MSKSLFKWFSLVLFSAVVSFGFVACEENNPDQPENPENPSNPDAVVLNINDGKASISNAAADVVIEYGEHMNAVTEVSAFPEWITDMNISAKNKIQFHVAENTSSMQRVADLTFSFDQEKVAFKLIQMGVENFKFELKTVKDTYFEVFVTPKDKEMRYVVNVMDKAGFYKHFTPGKDKDFIVKEQGWFEYLADQMGMTYEEYMNSFLKKGDQLVTIDDQIMPSSEYVFFTYGMNDEFEPLTDITYMDVKTAEIPQSEIDFEIRITDLVKGSFNTTIIPSRNDIGYYSNAYIKEHLLTVDKDLKKAIAISLNKQIQDDIYYYTVMEGKTKEEVIARYRVFDRQTYPTTNVMGGLNIVSYACAINEEGYVSSEVVIKEFQTIVVPPSENDIKCNFTNLTTSGFTAEFTTTTEDPYMIVATPADTWLGYTDEEILEELLTTYFNPADVVTGDQSIDFSGMEPGTECIVFAYGWDTMVTTKLFKFTVTTKK